MALWQQNYFRATVSRRPDDMIDGCRSHSSRCGSMAAWFDWLTHSTRRNHIMISIMYNSAGIRPPRCCTFNHLNLLVSSRERGAEIWMGKPAEPASQRLDRVKTYARTRAHRDIAYPLLSPHQDPHCCSALAPVRRWQPVSVGGVRHHLGGA